MDLRKIGVYSFTGLIGLSLVLPAFGASTAGTIRPDDIDCDVRIDERQSLIFLPATADEGVREAVSVAIPSVASTPFENSVARIEVRTTSPEIAEVRLEIPNAAITVIENRVFSGKRVPGGISLLARFSSGVGSKAAITLEAATPGTPHETLRLEFRCREKGRTLRSVWPKIWGRR